MTSTDLNQLAPQILQPIPNELPYPLFADTHFLTHRIERSGLTVEAHAEPESLSDPRP